jgi:hypothetical protein
MKKSLGSSTVLVLGLTAIAFVSIFVGTKLFSDKATVALIAEGSRYIQKNERFVVIVAVETPQSANTFAATIRFPADLLEVTNITKEDSLIDIWVQEPVWSNEKGLIDMSGGTIKGFQGGGKVARIEFNPKATGEAVIDFDDASVLAHDGRGTEILGKQRDITYLIRNKDLPSPDVNDDNTVTIGDFSALLSHLGGNDAKYDLNKDGKVDISDLSIILANFLK